MSPANVIVRILGIAAVFGIVSWLVSVPAYFAGFIWAVIGSVLAIAKGAADRLTPGQLCIGIAIGFIIMTILTWCMQTLLVAAVGAGPYG